MGRIIGVDVHFHTFLSRHMQMKASRTSKKGTHYTENPRKSTFYLIRKSLKLPLVSLVKDYSDLAIRSLREENWETSRPYGTGTEILGGLQPNFRYGSNAVSTDLAANGSFNSLPSPWNCRIISEVILNLHLRTRMGSSNGRSVDWSFCPTMSLRSVIFLRDRRCTLVASGSLPWSNDR